MLGTPFPFLRPKHDFPSEPLVWMVRLSQEKVIGFFVSRPEEEDGGVMVTACWCGSYDIRESTPKGRNVFIYPICISALWY